MKANHPGHCIGHHNIEPGTSYWLEQQPIQFNCDIKRWSSKDIVG